MIRRIAVMTAALLLAPAAVEARHRQPQAPEAPLPPEPPDAPLPPEPPDAPEAPRPPRPPRHQRSVQLNFDIPSIPEGAFDALDVLQDVDIPGLLADAWPKGGSWGKGGADAAARARDRARRAKDDEDGDDDSEDVDVDDDDADLPGKDDHGAHVYRMNQHVVIPGMRPRVERDRDDAADERDASAHAKGRGSATLPVKGPITFQVRAQGGDVEVVTTDKMQVSIALRDAPADDLALYAFGDRIEPSFRGRRLLRRGKLHVELPIGSRLDVSSMSGDVSAQRVGDVRIRTLSGDVKLANVAKSDVQSISGDVRIDGAAGPVRLHLVSGRATVVTSGSSPQVEFQSASGSLDWGGTCGRDCHLSAETVSGELRLAVDPHSSFELSYTSHSGELRDELELAVKHAPRRKHGMASGWLEATFGKGEGVIEADAFSGNLLVKKR